MVIDLKVFFKLGFVNNCYTNYHAIVPSFLAEVNFLCSQPPIPRQKHMKTRGINAKHCSTQI